MCCKSIQKQKATPECYIYEVNAPFHKPTHFIDITGIIDEKIKLVEFHKDQIEQKAITISLNKFRASQMISKTSVEYAECYLKINPYEIAYIERSRGAYDDLLVRQKYEY